MFLEEPPGSWGESDRVLKSLGDDVANLSMVKDLQKGNSDKYTDTKDNQFSVSKTW